MQQKNCNCNSNLNIISRRSFLSASAKSSMAIALSTLIDIPLVMKQALAAGIGSGKKLLFIWLRGANDSLNSVIPIQDSAYGTGIRPTLAIPKDAGTNYATVTGTADFFPSGSNSTYGSYPFAIRLGNGFAALHPSLKFLAPVYNDGNLALIHRVAYPKQSRSHFDSQRYWENGNPNNNLVNDGIFYRTMAEYLAQNPSASLTGVSIQSSLPLILRGSDFPMTNLTDPLRYDLLGVPNNTPGNLKATNFLNQANTYSFPNKNSRALLQLQYENLTNTLGIFAGINFTEGGNTFRDNVVTDGDSEWTSANGGDGYYLFPTTNAKNGGWQRPNGTTNANKYVVPTNLEGLFNQIKAAALILNNTDAIIAGTEYGNFDTHNNQGQLTGTHPDNNRAFGWAMYALQKYFTRYANKVDWNNVVVVTLTEFGRTTIENTTLGTDHAEAGTMFVAGGGVKGYLAGSRSGVYNCKDTTDYATNNPIPWTPGSAGAMFGVQGRYLSRVTDYRQVLGKLIRDHLGATPAQLNNIIPAYGNESTEHLAGGGTSTDGYTIRSEPDII
jgi:uncharacterized protein (DUF1501 family)